MALDTEAKFFQRFRIENTVILSFLNLFPLLAERKAITNYIQQTGTISLRSVLPEVRNIEEAIYLMKMEYLLSFEQGQQLKKLLEVFYSELE